MIISEYELMCVLDPSNIDDAKRNVISLIKENAGKIVSEKDLSVFTMAYPIKKHLKGFYYNLHIRIDRLNIIKLTKAFNINMSILTFMFQRFSIKKFIRSHKKKILLVDGKLPENILEKVKKIDLNAQSYKSSKGKVYSSKNQRTYDAQNQLNKPKED